MYYSCCIVFFSSFWFKIMVGVVVEGMHYAIISASFVKSQSSRFDINIYQFQRK
jgi:hypothetical protein